MMGRLKVDLTGQRFGKLVLLKEAPMRGTFRYWLCQCDCGSTPKEIAQHHLQSKRTISCGCIRRKSAPKIDLTGRKFGRLLAIAPTDQREHGKVVWECKCDCGNSKPIPVLSTYLINGDTKSCGCLKKEQDSANLIEGYENSRVDGVNTSLLEARLRDDNTSGHKGVNYHKATNKWFAQLTVDGKVYRSPTFEDKQKAIDARIELEEKYHKPYLESRQLKLGTCFDNLIIDDFMLLGEAVRRWNITSHRLKDRIKVARKNGMMNEFIEKGWAKFSAGESEKGAWILSKSLLEHWYGPEPIKIEKEEKDENN